MKARPVVTFLGALFPVLCLAQPLASSPSGDTSEREILFQLAVQEAKRLKLDARDDVRREIDKTLYRAFLEDSLRKSRTSVEPTRKELRAAYDGAPLIRLRHLVLHARTSGEATKAEALVTTLKDRLARGTSFKELVLEFSQDHGARFAGDLDFRGPHELPDALYQAGIKLKKGEVSGPIRLDGAVHLLELIARKPFQQAPAVYLSYLKGRLRRMKETEHLEARLKDLRKNADVKFVSSANDSNPAKK